MKRLHYAWYDRQYLVRRWCAARVRWMVWHLPRRVVMWSYIRVVAHATTGRWEHQIVPELGAMEALQRWEEA